MVLEADGEGSWCVRSSAIHSGEAGPHAHG
jgi:hypothetical protein